MKRKPWLSALLNFVFPGLGQLYCGHLAMAVVLYIIYMIVMNVAFGVLVFLGIHPLNVVAFALITLLMMVFLIFNGYKTAKKAPTEYTPKAFNKWYVYLVLVIGEVLFGSYLTPVFGNYDSYRMPSASMENTLKVGDYFLADLNAYNSDSPKPGDIVIFIFPGDLETRYVKRCVAVQGDTVSIENKNLIVNGITEPDEGKVEFIDTTSDGLPIIQPRLSDGKDSRDNFGPFVVPTDSYFMLGDSRDNSYDSRYYGAIDKSLIVGRVIRVFWSNELNRIGISPN